MLYYSQGMEEVTFILTKVSLFREFIVHNIISLTESLYPNEGYGDNFKINKPLHDLLPLRFVLVSSPAQDSLWNKLVDRYHYLGYSRIHGKRLGFTQGYSKVRGGYKYHGNKKEIFIYVIKKDFRSALQITSPWTPQKAAMSVHERLQEVRTMTFQDLDFNPDLIS
jgi:hypothetical protein